MRAFEIKEKLKYGVGTIYFLEGSRFTSYKPSKKLSTAEKAR